MNPSLILRTATRFLAAMILVFSVYLLLRGHNAPGGGFSGALVAGTGFALVAMAEGAGSVRRALRVDPRRLIAWGLGVALSAALVPVFSGNPFFMGIWWKATVSGDLEIWIGTPFVFDVGVFFVVLGTILTLMLALEADLEGR